MNIKYTNNAVAWRIEEEEESTNTNKQTNITNETCTYGVYPSDNLILSYVELHTHAEAFKIMYKPLLFK